PRRRTRDTDAPLPSTDLAQPLLQPLDDAGPPQPPADVRAEGAELDRFHGRRAVQRSPERARPTAFSPQDLGSHIETDRIDQSGFEESVRQPRSRFDQEMVEPFLRRALRQRL